MRKKGVNNVVFIEDTKKKKDVLLSCSICKKQYRELVKWNQRLDKLRCPKCVNPVEVVTPK